MSDNANEKHTTNLQFRDVPRQRRDELNNIAKRKGITLTQFLNSEIGKILNEYAQGDIPPAADMVKVEINSIPIERVKKIEEIAQHYGLTPQNFLRYKLVEIAASYPLRMRQPMKED